MINEEKRKIQLEALEALRASNFYGGVILPTGTGKSYVLIEALKEIYKPGMRVLYTCDSTLLRDVDFVKELHKWEGAEYEAAIERECYQSACKKTGQHYDILLADEGDYSLTPVYSNLYRNNTFTHIIFVSATLTSDKQPILKQFLPIVYQKGVKEIEDRGVINKAQFHLVPFMLNNEENRKYLSYKKRYVDLYARQAKGEDVSSQLEFLTFQRLHFLAELESSAYICRKLMKEIYEKDKECKILIFCGHTTQADKVCKYTYHEKSKGENNLEKFNNGEIQATAVCGKVDRGTNLNRVNNIIAEYVTRSETKMIQKTGRGRRLDVDEILDVYFLLPYYRQDDGKVRPSVVFDKISQALKNLGGIGKAKTYIVK